MPSLCKRCQDPALTPSDFSPDASVRSGRRVICKRCVREQRTAHREANQKKGLCVCGKKAAKDSNLCRACQIFARDKHRRLVSDPDRAARYNAGCRRRRQELKMQAFRAYGGPHCACCGESHVEFLSIDHINGREGVPRNARHRKGEGLYRWLKKHGWPPGFRVLCMNCNFALGHSGYCPHEQERAALKGSDSGSVSHILDESTHLCD